MNERMEATELAIRETELIAPASPERTLEVLKRFQEFKQQVLDKDDYVFIQGKKTVKKSGWLKYALACSLSLEKREEREAILATGTLIYHVTYRAIAPNGRFADAVGSASTEERNYVRKTHDVRALAQTRAMERAISNLVGGGELGAEELSEEEDIPEPQTRGHEERQLNLAELPWKAYEKNPDNSWIMADTKGAEWLYQEMMTNPDRRLEVEIGGKPYDLIFGYVAENPDVPRFIRRILVKEAKS